jgi:glycosyltransferase involved in cell wall biosynthesis
MAKKRVLYIVHNHPHVAPGGAEQYALELYEGMKRSKEFEPLLVARTGEPFTKQLNHPGTLFSSITRDPNQYLFYTSVYDHDYFLGVPNKSKEQHTVHFRSFLRTFRPEVVHFQHTVHLGYDLLREVRNTLPEAAIVYTLHEYLPICHRQGQMLRTIDNTPCLNESPRRCSECFPQISPQAFFMRKRFIQAQLSLVDLFLAPSRFLMDRYIDWGIPRSKLQFEENGRSLPAVPSDNGAASGLRNRFGFFGQITYYKGAEVLLEAMKLVRQPAFRRAVGVDTDPRVQLRVHGANLELQPEDVRARVRSLLEELRGTVTLVGRYVPSELHRHMDCIDWVVVPSIWWENSPLVIQESFMYGKPVICSNIGGMAEKVADGINGLHFRAGDPESLAETMLRAASTPDLWSKLRKKIRPPYQVEASVDRLVKVYNELLARREVIPR